MKSTSKQTSTPNTKKDTFLDKFKHKHSVISKQGLLKLFQSKRKSIGIHSNYAENKIQLINQDHQDHNKTNPKKQPKNHSPPTIKINIKQIENDKVQEIIKARSARKGSSDSVARSVQLPEVSKKLPNIQKSVSTTLKLHKKQLGVSGPKTDSLPKIMNKSPLKQNKHQKDEPRYNFELDKFAVDHLSFLQKFEERMRKREVTSH